MDVQSLASVFVLALLGFSSFFFLPPSIGGPPSPDAATTTTIANEPLQSMTANKLFNTFASCFQNQCSGAIRYLFKPTGFAAWHNVGAGNVTLTGFSVGGQSRSVSAFSNSTTIDYRITVPNVVTMDVYFKEKPTNGRPSNTFKVTMIGTSSVSGTFTWNFGNPQAFPVTCDNAKHILTYGTTGLNFTDATNFSATCTTTSVSFTIGIGAFRIDPSTITTNSNAATQYSHQGRTCIANGRYWVFYWDAANWGFRSTIDGQTFTSETTITTSGAKTVIQLSFYCKGTEVVYVAGQFSSTLKSFYSRYGTLNSDGTITWTVSEQTFASDYFCTGAFGDSVVLDSSSVIWIAITNAVTGCSSGFHNEVYNCSTNLSSCTLSLDKAFALGALIALTSGKLAFAYSSSAGATSSISIQTFSGSVWNSAVTTSRTNYLLGCSQFVAIGDTLEAAASGRTSSVCTNGVAEIHTYYWNYPYGGSISTETDVSNANEQSSGIATDGGSNLWITFADAGSNVKLIFSTNSGSTWSPAISLSSSETKSSFLSTSFFVTSNSIGIVWVSGISPVSVRFQLFTVNTPYIIQSTSCTGTGSTVNCAFASNTKAASSIVVFAGSTATTTVSGVTDTQSLTYSQIVGSDVGTVGDSEAWWACYPSTAAADTITVSYSLSVTATIILYELHGRPTGTSCGPSSSTGSSASSSTAAVGSYTPRANAFIIGALDSSCQVACTITAGSGYSLDFNVAINAVNDFTTEYFWNVATADTTPYTFSVASAYNEISVAFYDLVWTNSTATDTSTVTDSPARGLSLPRSPADTYTFSDSILKGVGKLVSDTFTFADSAINSVIGAAVAASRQTTGAILVFGIVIVFTLIALLVFGRRR